MVFDGLTCNMASRMCVVCSMLVYLFAIRSVLYVVYFMALLNCLYDAFVIYIYVEV